MNNAQPNAKQRQWREDVREMGSICGGGPVVIHHAAGRTARHNGVHIGHWWIVALSDDQHKDIHASGKARKSIEKELFEKTMKRYVRVYNRPIPVPLDVVEAIMSWHR